MDRSPAALTGTRKNRQPLAEYPRPQMQRGSYLNLNGYWQYAIRTGNARPETWDGEILVPFSPESSLSGVGRVLRPNETLWYRRLVTLPGGFLRETTLLHFGGVDQCCVVYWNGAEIGRHDGGYLPFTLDVSHHLQDGENELLLSVIDETETAPYMRGWQNLVPGEGRRSPMSGIWQTVWMESLPQSHVTSLRITPLYDEQAVEITVFSSSGGGRGELSIYALSTEVAKRTFTAGQAVQISLPGALSWHPRNPFLYHLSVTFGQDSIVSYFGMRKIHIEPDGDGFPRVHLNNRPLLLRGILDEGYWRNGLYTPPSESAMKDDLQFIKQSGFNMVRKSSKLEPLRWYHLCDKLGLLAWQDLPGGGGPTKLGLLGKLTKGKLRDSHYRHFGRASEEGRETFLRDADRISSLLYNVPSLCLYTLFNEGYGQFDAAALAAHFREQDPSRLIDHASGGYDQGGGKFCSLHVTPGEPLPLPPQNEPRAFALTACGGYRLAIPGNTAPGAVTKTDDLPNVGALEEALQSLWHALGALVPKGLAVFCYSRLSDAGGDISGLLTWSHQIQKVDPRLLAKLNEALPSL